MFLNYFNLKKKLYWNVNRSIILNTKSKKQFLLFIKTETDAESANVEFYPETILGACPLCEPWKSVNQGKM